MKVTGCFLVLFCPLSFAIFVAEFQMDGKYTTETYMNYTSLRAENVIDFTVCWRQYVHFLRGLFTPSISYASNSSDNAFVADLKRIGLQNVFIKICKNFDLGIECLEFELKDDIFQNWQHFCFVITYETLNVSKISTSSQLYVSLH